MSEDDNRAKLHDLFAAVFRLKMTYKHRCILLAYIEEADPETGLVTASLARIGWKVDASESTVRRVMKVLVSEGVMTIERPSRGRIPSTYAFHLEAGIQKQPCQSSARVDYTQPFQLSDRVEPYQLSDRVKPTLPTVDRVNPSNYLTGLEDINKQYTNTVDRELLIEAWASAQPKRPQYTHTKRNLELAAQLANEGFTIAEVTQLTISKCQGRNRQYKFEWLATDIRVQRQVQQSKGEKLPSQYTSALDGIRLLS